MIQLDRYDSGKLDRARAIVRDLDSVLVAFSGGVDSTLLLKLALEQLADRAVAVLASSPAYPESEQKEARAMARSLGARPTRATTPIAASTARRSCSRRSSRSASSWGCSTSHTARPRTTPAITGRVMDRRCAAA